jgi:hypothetical protein
LFGGFFCTALSARLIDFANPLNNIGHVACGCFLEWRETARNMIDIRASVDKRDSDLRKSVADCNMKL